MAQPSVTIWCRVSTKKCSRSAALTRQAQQRAALKVERLVRLVIGQLLQAVRTGSAGQGAEVLPVQVQAAVFGHALVGHPSMLGNVVRRAS